jgi:major type 1 subunit fimbrin (pilin)
MSNFLKFIFIFFISSLASAEQIKINLNARVLEKACTLSNDNVIVSMPIGEVRGKKVNSSFGKTKFSIIISNCPNNISNAHIAFKADADINNPQLIKNMEADGYAKGVALGLFDSNENIIDISSNSTDILIDHALAENKIDFSVAYFKSAVDSRAGKVLGIVEFGISYD